jgi:prevent-host-death family protein
MVTMTIVVSVAEAKATLSELLRRAEEGEDIVVARNGQPVAKLSPVRRREGGFMRGEVIVHDPEWWAADAELAEQFGN